MNDLPNLTAAERDEVREMLNGPRSFVTEPTGPIRHDSMPQIAYWGAFLTDKDCALVRHHLDTADGMSLRPPS